MQLHIYKHHTKTISILILVVDTNFIIPYESFLIIITQWVNNFVVVITVHNVTNIVLLLLNLFLIKLRIRLLFFFCWAKEAALTSVTPRKVNELLVCAILDGVYLSKLILGFKLLIVSVNLHLLLLLKLLLLLVYKLTVNDAILMILVIIIVGIYKIVAQFIQLEVDLIYCCLRSLAFLRICDFNIWRIEIDPCNYV